jgi:NAD(P)-dependent dehydrogenase (short-subunit alcohol dehydrogenase family)
VTAALKLAGKTAVVTGSGRGIGRAIALALAREGARVGLVARTRTELEEAATEARKAGGEALAASAYLVTRALLPWLIESGGGRIINVSSGLGHRPGAGSSAYRVGKAGLWMLTQCLAEELWTHGIEVNELIPGPGHTTLTAARFASSPPPFAPSERLKTPDEVVPLALWLATQPPGGPTAQSFSLARRPL